MDPPEVPSPSSSGAHTNGEDNPSKGKSRAVTIEDVEEDTEPGSSDFAPGGDADYFAEEDEEGRFYGGGLTEEQKKILNIFDGSANDGAQDDVRESLSTIEHLAHLFREWQLDELSITGIRRLLLRFERAVNKNQDQRSKHPDDPSKYVNIRLPAIGI